MNPGGLGYRYPACRFADGDCFKCAFLIMIDGLYELVGSSEDGQGISCEVGLEERLTLPRAGSVRIYNEPFLSPARVTECLQAGSRFSWENLLHSCAGNLNVLVHVQLEQRSVIIPNLRYSSITCLDLDSKGR